MFGINDETKIKTEEDNPVTRFDDLYQFGRNTIKEKKNRNRIRPTMQYNKQSQFMYVYTSSPQQIKSKTNNLKIKKIPRIITITTQLSIPIDAPIYTQSPITNHNHDPQYMIMNLVKTINYKKKKKKEKKKEGKITIIISKIIIC